jgi:hypothetical protein
MRDLLLPCGCLIGHRKLDGKDTFVIEPCRVTCPNYLAYLKAAAEKPIPTQFHCADDRDMRRRLNWHRR